MNEQDEQVAHPGNSINTSKVAAFRQIWQFAIDGLLWTNSRAGFIGFGVHCGTVHGVALCGMFRGAIRGKSLPRYLSSDHDPLYRFHPCKANLGVLDVTEIKTVPYMPLSHPFVERLIGTLRREYLDRILYWTTVDRAEKLTAFPHYYNGRRAHAGLEGCLPEPGTDGPTSPIDFKSYRRRRHCRGLYQTPLAA